MPETKQKTKQAGKGVLVIDKEYSGTAFGQSMAEAAKHHNKGVFSQIGEFARLAFSRNRLSPKEYYDFRLFDDSQYDWAQKKTFVGAQGAASISLSCNVLGYSGIFGDKHAFYGLLGGLGFPVPETLALYHEGRKLPGVRVINERAELVNFLKKTKDYPLFTKPSRSSLSLGAASIASCNAGTGKLTGADGREFSIIDYLDDVDTYRDKGYLIQKMLVPHEITQPYSGNSIATLRLLTLRTPKGPKLHRAAWKIPAAHNVADNFWRSGNVIAHVDMKSGNVRRIVRGLGIGQETVEPSEINASLKHGLVVPDWHKAVDLVLSATEAFANLNVVGWDIGVSKNGPVVVEANDLPDLRLHQIADATGIMDQEMKDYVAYCKAEKKRLEREFKRMRKKHVQKEIHLAVDQSTLRYKAQS